MSQSTEFQIEKKTVYGRDETGAKLLGWTTEELFTMLGAIFVAVVFVPVGWMKLATVLLTYLWIKKLKALFPERFFSSLLRYYFRIPHYLRASVPDTEWRPPIRSN